MNTTVAKNVQIKDLFTLGEEVLGYVVIIKICHFDESVLVQCVQDLVRLVRDNVHRSVCCVQRGCPEMAIEKK